MPHCVGWIPRGMVAGLGKERKVKSELGLLAERVSKLEKQNRLLLRLVAGLLALMALGILLAQDEARRGHEQLRKTIERLTTQPVARIPAKTPGPVD